MGDLRGITSRLDHLEWLGVDALWLSPFYPRRCADWGTTSPTSPASIEALGTLDDVDELIAQAHRAGPAGAARPRALPHLDRASLVSRAPRRYVWADDGPPNNWVATFGGPAWSRDERSGRWYLHSFYPEQPDLDWRRAGRAAGVRRGGPLLARARRGRVSGRRGRPADEGRGAARRPARDGAVPASAADEYARLEHAALGATTPRWGARWPRCARRPATCFLVGEVYLPAERLRPYLEHLDIVFAFEFLHAPFDAGRARRGRSAPPRRSSASPGSSPTTTSRGSRRFGPIHAPALAALLLLTLPGAAFVYQGDEIGMVDGPGAEPPVDRAGRDPHRHPMQWDARAERRLHRRRRPGSRHRPRRTEASPPSRGRTGLAARALPRADRAAARARPGLSSSSTRRRDVLALPPRAGTSSRSTWAPRSAGLRGAGRARIELSTAGRPTAAADALARRGWMFVHLKFEHVVGPYGHRPGGEDEPEPEGETRLALPQPVLLGLGGALAAAPAPTTAEGSGTELSFFIFNEPSGAYQEAAKACSEAVERRVHDLVRVPARPGRRPARAARAPARRRGRLDRHHRHGRDLDGRVRERRLGARALGGSRREQAVTDGIFDSVVESASFEGHALRGPIHLEHPAPLVPQGPGREAAEDLARDARRGRADRRRRA